MELFSPSHLPNHSSCPKLKDPEDSWSFTLRIWALPGRAAYAKTWPLRAAHRTANGISNILWFFLKPALVWALTQLAKQSSTNWVNFCQLCRADTVCAQTLASTGAIFDDVQTDANTTRYQEVLAQSHSTQGMRKKHRFWGQYSILWRTSKKTLGCDPVWTVVDYGTVWNLMFYGLCCPVTFCSLKKPQVKQTNGL